MNSLYNLGMFDVEDNRIFAGNKNALPVIVQQPIKRLYTDNKNICITSP